VPERYVYGPLPEWRKKSAKLGLWWFYNSSRDMITKRCSPRTITERNTVVRLARVRRISDSSPQSRGGGVRLRSGLRKQTMSYRCHGWESGDTNSPDDTSRLDCLTNRYHRFPVDWNYRSPAIERPMSRYVLLITFVAQEGGVAGPLPISSRAPYIPKCG